MLHKRFCDTYIKGGLTWNMDPLLTIHSARIVLPQPCTILQMSVAFHLFGWWLNSFKGLWKHCKDAKPQKTWSIVAEMRAECPAEAMRGETTMPQGDTESSRQMNMGQINGECSCGLLTDQDVLVEHDCTATCTLKRLNGQVGSSRLGAQERYHEIVRRFSRATHLSGCTPPNAACSQTYMENFIPVIDPNFWFNEQLAA